MSLLILLRMDSRSVYLYEIEIIFLVMWGRGVWKIYIFVCERVYIGFFGNYVFLCEFVKFVFFFLF